MPLADARRVYVARTYAYVAAKKDGLVIVDVDATRARRASTRSSTFDGAAQRCRGRDRRRRPTPRCSPTSPTARNGLKVLQLTSPDSQPNFYGFSPGAEARADRLGAARPRPALALSKGLDRDRAVDETGNQIAVFGRLGSRPFNRPEMERFFTDRWGRPYRVTDAVDMTAWLGPRPTGQADR